MPTVLVVDDAAVDRKLVGGLLAKGPNLKIEFAATAEDALVQIAKTHPDLVVTDLVMPGMSGLELVGQIIEQSPQTPVILMTGKGSEEVAVRALKAGAASYVPKGVLHQLLLNTVEDVLLMVEERSSHARLMDCMRRGKFHFELSNDANLIPLLVTHVQS